MSAVTETFHAANIEHDNRFVFNAGGDGSNEASRFIYDLIPYVNDSTPDLKLELWTDSSDADTKMKANLILHGSMKD
jgi:hypothetical protein